MPAMLTLTGNIGGKFNTNITPEKVPEKAFCFFSVADSQMNKENPVWYNIKSFGKDAEYVVKYLKTGQKVLVVGRLDIELFDGKETRKVTAFAIEGFKTAENNQNAKNETCNSANEYKNDLPF